jgi:hypothetical protein
MDFWQRLSSTVSNRVSKKIQFFFDTESKLKKIFGEAASRLRVLAEPTNDQVSVLVEPTDDQISARAYQLWEEAGKPIGNDQEFWNRAKEELGVVECKNQ